MYTLERGYMIACGNQVKGCGYLIGHPEVDDGVFVDVSRIKRVIAESDGLAIHTSGSCYNMKYADMDEDRFEETKAALKKLKVRFKAKKIQKAMQDSERKMVERLKGVLKPFELYLRLLIDESLTHAFYMDAEGNITKAQIKYHVGDFQDSVLVVVDGKCDFRFWPKGLDIEPYHWANGLEAVKIHCICSDIYFSGSSSKILLKQGEITKIEAKEYTGEALMSPDYVDGKSILTDSWESIFGE